jgi:DNA invertase Pin-like site-specific DNA recombinase
MDKKTGKDLQGGDSQTRSEAARLMGQAVTEKKQEAARENGKKGGRPPGTPMSEEAREKIRQALREKHAERKNLKNLENK